MTTERFDTHIGATNIGFDHIEAVLKRVLSDDLYDRCVNAKINDTIMATFSLNDQYCRLTFVKRYYRNNEDLNYKNLIVFDYSLDKKDIKKDESISHCFLF